MNDDYDYWIGAGDAGLPIEAQLTDGAGQPIEVAVDTPLTFRMWDDRTKVPVVLSGAATWRDTALAIAQYQWNTADLPARGSYAAEFVATVAAGPISAPGRGYLKIRVKAGGAP
jgi:hypothetical protein